MKWDTLCKFWIRFYVVLAILFFGNVVLAASTDDGTVVNGAADLGKDLTAALGLIQFFSGLVKTLVPKIPERLVPLIPLLLGVLYGVFVSALGDTLTEKIMFGVSFGLQAGGSYRLNKVMSGNGGNSLDVPAMSETAAGVKSKK